MKKKNFNLFLIILSVLMLGAITNLFDFDVNKNKKIYADEITDSTPITDDGAIISKELWTALESFYNANKTDETSGRIHRESNSKYFYIDLFEGFTETTLDLSSKNILAIHNLDILDLSPFTSINLSNNLIEFINNGLSKITNLENLDLSGNLLRSFSYSVLNENVYTTTLTTLNLSNNSITDCDIEKIAQGEIDVRLNEITKENLKLPENLNVKVYLSHNLIDNPDTSNENLYFGFQGAKDNATYVVGQNIYFYGFDDVTQIKIYSLTQEGTGESQHEVETEIETLNSYESYEFALGYYRIKFIDAETEDLMLKPISVYICPPTPSIEMYVGDKKLEEINLQLYTPTTVKFLGENGATFVYSLNNNELIYANEVKIDKNGINILTVYQIIDGYRSQGYQIFLTYKQSTTMSWLLILAGVFGFAILFYVVLKYLPQISSIRIGKKDGSNKNNADLD